MTSKACNMSQAHYTDVDGHINLYAIKAIEKVKKELLAYNVPGACRVTIILKWN